MRLALSLAATSALAAALVHVPGDTRPYLDGPAPKGSGSEHVRIIRPHRRHDAAGTEAPHSRLKAPSSDARSKAGAGERLIVPHGTVAPSPPPEATQADDGAGPGLGGSGAASEPKAGGAADAAGAAAPPSEEADLLEQQNRQLGQQVGQLQQQVTDMQAALQRGATPPSEREDELANQIGELRARAHAVEASRESRAAAFAQSSSLLGEAQLQLITGDAQVGDYLDGAERLLYEAGAQAVALGPADEVEQARAAVRAIDLARYWIDNSDLWNARRSLDTAIYETQHARHTADGYAVPIEGPVGSGLTP